MNAAICHSCCWVAISSHTHDFRSCLCGDVAVDGGPDYKRRVFAPGAEWTEVVSLDDANEWVRLRSVDWWATP